LAPIPEHGSSLSLEKRGPTHTGKHQPYAHNVPMPSLTHSYELLESLPRVLETPPKIAQSVVTPILGTFLFPVSAMSGQLSVVSATHTAPTVSPNLRTVHQAMHNVMSNVANSSIVAPGAAVSTAACTAPSYRVPVANTTTSQAVSWNHAHANHYDSNSDKHSW